MGCQTLLVVHLMPVVMVASSLKRRLTSLVDGTPKEQTGLIDEVSFSDPWYRNHTPPFKAALEDGTFKNIPKTDRVLADLRAFRVVKGIPKIPAATAAEDRQGIKRHADTAISLLLLRHAQFTIEAKVREYSYEAVKDNPTYLSDDTQFHGFKRGVL